MTDCRRLIIDFQVSKRFQDSVFFNLEEEDVSCINQNAGVFAESAQLPAIVGKLKENNLTFLTEKSEVKVLLEN